MTRTLSMLAVLAVAAMSGFMAPSGRAATSGPAIPERPIFATAPPGGGDPRVRLSPIRFKPKASVPGTVLRYGLRVTNHTERTVALAPIAIPLEGSSNPNQFAEPGSSKSRSAAAVDWVSFPGFGDRIELRPGMEVRFPASVVVPRDATPGTYSLGIGVSQTIGAPATNLADGTSTQVRVKAILPSVALIRVPGEAASELRLHGLQAPRFVWSSDRPTFRVRVKNVGDTDLVVDGKVDLSSFLSSAGRTLNSAGPERGYPTLPGGTRELKMRWTDPPLLGWFQPELVVVGGKGTGVRITDNLETVYVLPPWWLVLLLAIAICLPVRMRRRRRKDPARAEQARERARERIEGRAVRDEAKRRAADARRRR